MKEFKEFQDIDPVSPPRYVTERVLNHVHQDMNPSAWVVFFKLSSIHLVMGLATLSLCPQFGFGLTSGMGLMALFMRFGDQACMLGCGAVFMGVSALTASLVLRSEELRVIRKREVLPISILSLLSMGAFVCTGAEIIASLGAFWVLGSIIGGLGTFELGIRLRRRIRVYA